MRSVYFKGSQNPLLLKPVLRKRLPCRGVGKNGAASDLEGRLAALIAQFHKTLHSEDLMKVLEAAKDKEPAATISLLIGAMTPHELAGTSRGIIEDAFVLRRRTHRSISDTAGGILGAEPVERDGALVRPVDVDELNLLFFAVLRHLDIPCYFAYMDPEAHLEVSDDLEHMIEYYEWFRNGLPKSFVLAFYQEVPILISPPFVTSFQTMGASALLEVLDDECVDALFKMKLARHRTEGLMMAVLNDSYQHRAMEMLEAIEIGHLVHEADLMWPLDEAEKAKQIAAEFHGLGDRQFVGIREIIQEGCVEFVTFRELQVLPIAKKFELDGFMEELLKLASEPVFDMGKVVELSMTVADSEKFRKINRYLRLIDAIGRHSAHAESACSAYAGQKMSS